MSINARWSDSGYSQLNHVSDGRGNFYYSSNAASQDLPASTRFYRSNEQPEDVITVYPSQRLLSSALRSEPDRPMVVVGSQANPYLNAAQPLDSQLVGSAMDPVNPGSPGASPTTSHNANRPPDQEHSIAGHSAVEEPQISASLLEGQYGRTRLPSWGRTASTKGPRASSMPARQRIGHPRPA